MSMFEGGDDEPPFGDWDIRELTGNNSDVLPVGDASELFDAVDPAFLRPEAQDEEVVDAPLSPTEILVARIRDEVSVEMDAIAADLQNDQGGLEHAYHLPGAVLPVAIDLAAEAAAAGDLASVEKYVRAFDRPIAADDMRARLCYVGVAAGSRESFTRLDTLISGEQRRYGTRHRQYRDGQTGSPLSAVLEATKAVIEASTEQGVPADAWIGKAAINTDHRHDIEVSVLAEAVRRGDADQAVLDAKIMELVSATDVEPRHMLQVARTLLTLAKDLAVRGRVVDQLQDSLDNGRIPVNQVTYRELTRAATAVVADPEIATQARVLKLKSMVMGATASAIEHGVIDEYTAGAYLIMWNVNCERLENPDMGSVEIIEAIDRQIARVAVSRVSDELESDTNLPDQYWEDHAYELRNSILSAKAKELVDTGDFAGANLYVQAIGKETDRSEILKTCLDTCRTPEQLATIRMSVDELALSVNPRLAEEIERTELLVCGSADQKVARAVQYVQALADPGTATHIPRLTARLAFIERVFEDLPDPDESTAAEHADGSGLPSKQTFARTVVAAMRAQGVMPSATRWYSEYLIASGDTEEAARAYAHIDNSGLYPAGRVASLWRLAQVMGGWRYPDNEQA